MAFDLARYLADSKQLDLSGIDFSKARRHPASPEEIRCLGYMMDIEAHTLCYLRDLLNTTTPADPEIADFLACWFFEESYHGRAIERFVREAGHDRPVAVCARRGGGLVSALETMGAALLSRFTPNFSAVHMTWGAIQEITTLNGYKRLIANTENPVLAELLSRIVRDESKHFSFYYHKAEEKLAASPAARKLTAFLLRRFWTPVGGSVKPRSEVDFMITFCFQGAQGREALRHIDRTIARLPGMGWFRLLEDDLDAALRRAPPAASRAAAVAA